MQKKDLLFPQIVDSGNIGCYWDLLIVQGKIPLTGWTLISFPQLSILKRKIDFSF